MAADPAERRIRWLRGPRTGGFGSRAEPGAGRPWVRLARSLVSRSATGWCAFEPPTTPFAPCGWSSRRGMAPSSTKAAFDASSQQATIRPRLPLKRADLPRRPLDPPRVPEWVDLEIQAGRSVARQAYEDLPSPTDSIAVDHACRRSVRPVGSCRETHPSPGTQAPGVVAGFPPSAGTCAPPLAPGMTPASRFGRGQHPLVPAGPGPRQLGDH